MKKIAIVLTSVLLLLALVGCGTFSYNIRSYVDVADVKDVTIKRADVDKEIEDSVKDLLSSYKGEDDITEGTVESGNTVYIYYSGTAQVFSGLYSFKVGESGFGGLDDALKDVEFKDGSATFDVKLPADFTFPEEIAEALKAKTDAEEAKNAETETPTAETAEETAEPTAEPTETIEGTVIA